MIAYIKNFITELREKSRHYRPELAEVLEEINRLDPRDFEAAFQAKFMFARQALRSVVTRAGPNINEHSERALLDVLEVLDHYRGEGSRAVSRSFAFVANPDLRGIIERDYAELQLTLFPGHAWKSTVVMAGSILEAILYDRLCDPKWITKANVSAKKGNGNLPGARWDLETFIDVAVEIGLLPKDPADTIHQVLRKYRNFIHPRVEIRAAHACTEAEGDLAKGALGSVCNYLEANR